MENQDKKPIRSFKDLRVYQITYRAAITVMTKIVPKLPDDEKSGLKKQLSNACKSIPALIAEGYAKKHQKKHFQRYLDDAMGESNEMITHLSFCKDIYGKYIKYIEDGLCDRLIEIYDIAGRQLYTLAKKWTNFKDR